ncbi:MAG TPA: GNAT family N-acetyltransferase [Clostridiales bacterium]|nr:GNAT family N-acetyltransferase [Clostridiales bacterium]
MMNVFIRYANTNDCVILGEIHSESLRFSCAGIFPDDYIMNKFSPERRREGFRRELSLGYPETAILFADGIPAGLFTFGKSRYGEVDDSCIEIWRIYLKPEYIGKGFGTVLMEWGLEELRKKGYKQAVLWVLEDNHRARKFYERHGFVFDGKVRVFEDGIRELRYSKALD